MRYIRFSFAVKLFMVLFMTLFVVSVFGEPVFRSAEEVLIHFEESMRDRNPELFEACYWPDARKIRVTARGIVDEFGGRDDIVESQVEVFQELGRELEDFHLPEPERYYETHNGMPQFIFREPGGPATEMFQFQERHGEWRIREHRVYERHFEDAEVGEMQEPFDEDRNGRLEPHEQEGLFEALFMVFNEHEVMTPLDEMMDLNGDGFLAEDEAHRARSMLLRDRLRGMFVFDPEFARSYLDSDRDEEIGLHEANIATFDFVLAPERNEPIPADIREFALADFDEDMWISRDELYAYRELVLRMAAVLPEPPALLTRMEGTLEEIAQWSDCNRDGRISDSELRDLGIHFFQSLQHEEIVTSPVLLRYDHNRDYHLSDDERERMREELITQVLPFAVEHYREEYPETEIMDIDENGRIEQHEIVLVVDTFTRLEEILREPPGNEFEHRLDRDPKNGTLEEWEVFEPFENIQTVVGRGLLETRGESLAGGRDSEDPADGREGQEEEIPEIESARVKEDESGGRAQMEIKVTLDPVFPVLFKYYDEASVGKASISNTGGTAVTELTVKLDMDRYIDSPRVSASIDRIDPGEKKEVDLLALFNEQAVLAITEGTKAAAEVIVEYTASGESRRITVTQTMEFYDRNALTWDDDRKAAAFVTARDNNIQLFAKNMNAALRDHKRNALSGNLQLGMILFDAVKTHGLAYSVDPGSSYAVLSADGASVDYLQFPSQTLAFKSGDCDDLTVCYNALLEAVGVNTALVTVPGHIFPAFALDMSEQDARKSFLYPEDLIFGKNGKVWMPVEITLLTGNFLEAWTSAAKQWREYKGKDKAKLYPTSECWKTYAPVGYAGTGTGITPPDSKQVLSAFEADMEKFVSREIAQRELTLLAKLEKKPKDAPTLNRLGTLYARYGLPAKAEKRFTAAVKAREYFPALLNLGHVKFLKKSYSEALGYYNRALALKENSASAILAVARANYELQNYGNVGSNYKKLKALSPSLALQFNYLDLQGSDTRRAADAMRLKTTIIWEDDKEDESL